MRTKLAGAVAGLALGAAALSPTPAMAASSEKITCNASNPTGTQVNWKGKDPKKCSGVYMIQKNGKVVLRVNNNKNGPGFYGVAKEGYDATQKWCSKNSATCGVVTAVGVGILMRFI